MAEDVGHAVLGKHGREEDENEPRSSTTIESQPSTDAPVGPLFFGRTWPELCLYTFVGQVSKWKQNKIVRMNKKKRTGAASATKDDDAELQEDLVQMQHVVGKVNNTENKSDTRSLAERERAMVSAVEHVIRKWTSREDMSALKTYLAGYRARLQLQGTSASQPALVPACDAL